MSKKLTEDGILQGYTTKHIGVRSVLTMDGTNVKSERVEIPWSDLEVANSEGAVTFYR